MDGENNGKPYEQMDDLGGKNPIFGSTPKWVPAGFKTAAWDVRICGGLDVFFKNFHELNRFFKGKCGEIYKIFRKILENMNGIMISTIA